MGRKENSRGRFGLFSSGKQHDSPGMRIKPVTGNRVFISHEVKRIFHGQSTGLGIADFDASGLLYHKIILTFEEYGHFGQEGAGQPRFHCHSGLQRLILSGRCFVYAHKALFHQGLDAVFRQRQLPCEEGTKRHTVTYSPFHGTSLAWRL